MATKPIRVLLAKPGLDSHDRGIKIVAQALRDAGMEVIYAGLFQTPESILSCARQEDGDAVGISILSGSHLEHRASIMEHFRAQGAQDLPVVCGGTIPPEGFAALERLNVKGLFPPGTPLSVVVGRIRELAGGRLPDLRAGPHEQGRGA